MPRAFWYREWFQYSIRGMSCGLDPMADMTISYETINILAEGRPVVGAVDQFQGLYASRMSNCRWIMVILEDPQAQLVVARHINPIPVGQTAIFFATFGQRYLSAVPDPFT